MTSYPDKGRVKDTRQAAHDRDRDSQVPDCPSDDGNQPQPPNTPSDSVSLSTRLLRNIRVRLSATGRNAVFIVVVLSVVAVAIWAPEAVALPALVVLGGAFWALASGEK